MFCPNCGVEIHIEGSFCAKCRKNIAYLTQEESTQTEPAPIDAESSEETVNMIPSPKKGFYCNHCGTFVYPEDNYCYQCGNKTRKEYYNSTAITKKGFFSFGK